MQRDDIQKQGAQAAREGLTFWDCPYYRADAMPAHTGETIAEWRDKVEAWEAGWMTQAGKWKPPPGGRPRYVPRSTEPWPNGRMGAGPRAPAILPHHGQRKR
ncbi:CrpP-related protein [Achromobacter denitrificans]|uniref:CrpP-related protein n=1 Tax=Achromobacter denitrificans TaxID=32002 RepID=UPI000A517625|nr:CrpP-related protein [Achromobacter denitrificans]MDF3939259.1 hypothetical protein [Achromobacter denitrificans]QCS66754.1 hypothetical protein EC609_32875 [Achromobacter denitrificans]QKH39930.1 hypothetical protein FOC82_02345 [Achromobacter denitrificans]QKH47904.1 hypothetical protein FOC80_24805 [Achromobacter denitrificans]RSE80864.1 hypothetical protein EGU64_20720 [Achromobacter denitrificans]